MSNSTASIGDAGLSKVAEGVSPRGDLARVTLKKEFTVVGDRVHSRGQ